MTTSGNYTISNLQYSVNKEGWKNVVKDEEVTFGGTNGDLRLRGTNPNGTANNANDYSTITFTNPKVNVACTGDIRTLQDWNNYNTVETQNARFCYLFNGCSVLTSAPELPATVLEESCYAGMFSGCTKLSTVTMLAPSDQITSVSDCCKDWLKNAGTDGSVKWYEMVLILKNYEAHKALKDKSYLPDNWNDAQITTVE